MSGAPHSVGTYTVLATFPGSTDYASASSMATFTVNPATPTVHVSDAGGIFDGSAFLASALVEGATGGLGAALEGIAPLLTYLPAPTLPFEVTPPCQRPR